MSAPHVIESADERAVTRIAQFLAIILRPGDVIALSGALGAGKTTFARAVIRAVLDDPSHDIPSPSFPLVQNYEGGRLPVAHFDFYRLKGGDELEELGLYEVLNDGAALIEWPERAADALPRDRLDITFDDGEAEESRRLTLAGQGAWRERCDRFAAMMAFCEHSAWRDARPVFLQGDASARSYARLHRGEDSAILMDSPPMPDGPPVRGGRAYSQIVHLAEDVRPFVAVAQALEKAGLSVPVIIHHDLEQGFLLTSDLGDRVFASETGENPPFEELYRAAIDVLAHLKSHPPSGALPLLGKSGHDVPVFDCDAFLAESELLLDWFYPAVHGTDPAPAIRDAFLEIFSRLHAAIEGKDTAWVLRDYHSPNLMWLPEREGLARVGVIDFQDAMCGHAAYDVVSLLQDARRDVPASLEALLYDHYCELRKRADSDFDAQAFAAAYAIHGAQRNSKIIGIFARLAKRDGKHGYLAHIPRVSGYLERDLAHPFLSDLRAWFDEHLPTAMRERDLRL